ncbi:MAG TPA: sigma-54 dependent transcriptional regulator [Pirellulales bacterium]|nr:sigma-54 dependent transcriptional regulator [Pirellulales bacterium]
MASILLIDDDVDFSAFVRESLQRVGHRVECLDNARSAPARLAGEEYDVVLLDNRMPGMSGIEFLAALEKHQISVPVILMTGDPTSDTAIQAMNLGAFDYVVKPLELDELLGELEPLIDEAAEISRLTKEHVRLPGEASDGQGPALLGNSRPMQEVYKLIGKVARSNVPVLILGESGTGKDLVARAIHGNSPRRQRPFVAMNCTALSETLLDDELFGHEPKSFSGASDKLRKGRFEHAHGGTLFLDEIGDMPPMLQAKLLRVLENSEVVRIGGNDPIKVDVRVVSATHSDPSESIASGAFRQDLLFRIKGVTIRLPPLRERGDDDLKLIFEQLIVQAAERAGRATPTLTDAAWKKLREHSWPGNIRELKNVVIRAVLVCRGTHIVPSDLELERSPTDSSAASPACQGSAIAHLARAVQAALVSGQADLHQSLHDALDVELLRSTLAECGGNQVQTSRRLGLSRNGLRARMRALGLE